MAMPPFFGGGEMIREVRLKGTVFADPPHRFEAGTPNIAGFAGRGRRHRVSGRHRLRSPGRYEQDSPGVRHGGARNLPPGYSIFGRAKEKEPVISFLLEGAHANDMATLLDLQGAAVRSGHHCAHPLMHFFGVPRHVACLARLLQHEGRSGRVRRCHRRVRKAADVSGVRRLAARYARAGLAGANMAA